MILGALGVVAWQLPLYGAEAAVVIPPPAFDNPKAAGALQTAVLSGGCFWGVQGVFEHLRGVKQVVAGYAGGERSTAQYETVSSGTTGHAESVKITFDPAEVSYGQILQVAFSVVHDPTELNRQGPDVGSQYRSSIFYADDTQKSIAQSYIKQLDQAHVYPQAHCDPGRSAARVLRGESYHQDYLVHNPTQPYIAYNDIPKVENFKRVFPDLYNGKPVLVSSP